MSTQSMLTRLIAPLALAVSVAGFAATSQAAPFNPVCGGGLCFNKDTQGYVNDRTYFYLTFKGGAVTHYNIRYRGVSGREQQYEVQTRPGTNATPLQNFKGTPGSRYTISVQACNRTKVIFIVVISSRSSCTAWRTITYTAV